MKSDIQCLISAGPTREWIDPVRFISNPSSGKMGYALAQAAQKRGIEVTLVSGPVNLKVPDGVRSIMVETAQEMNDAMQALFEKADVTIMAAAVCDHRPQSKHGHKLKKNQHPSYIKLEANPDILESLGRRKKSSQILVGFAAETENHLVNAMTKIHNKNLDWIALNDVSRKGLGFQSDFNAITMLSKDEETVILDRDTKLVIASRILKLLFK
ncbi:MAG: phosphopantothenoylcysteine decarboxylase [Opitutales bacterium]|nr:phosphopantothenoylcysteine decarboxylase [Opitutales bacterium]